MDKANIVITFEKLTGNLKFFLYIIFGRFFITDVRRDKVELFFGHKKAVPIGTAWKI
jgi:hypothetical protein